MRLVLVLALLTALPAAATEATSTDYGRKTDASDRPPVRPSRRTTGSAFLVGSDGFLVTNAHVIMGCDDPHLVIGGSAKPIKVVLTNSNIDVAILSSPTDANKTGFNLRTDVKIGQHVTIFGFPLVPSYAENGRATLGVLLGLSKDGQRLMTNAQVQAGNSGGPIIDQSGSVVGVAFGKSVNRTFAISASAIIDVFDKLNMRIPISSSSSIFSVAEIIDTARRSTGKIDCRS